MENVDLNVMRQDSKGNVRIADDQEFLKIKRRLDKHYNYLNPLIAKKRKEKIKELLHKNDSSISKTSLPEVTNTHSLSVHESY